MKSKEYHKQHNKNYYKESKENELLYPERSKSKNRVKEFMEKLRGTEGAK